jgi:hypothetical protein
LITFMHWRVVGGSGSVTISIRTELVTAHRGAMLTTLSQIFRRACPKNTVGGKIRRLRQSDIFGQNEPNLKKYQTQNL